MSAFFSFAMFITFFIAIIGLAIGICALNNSAQSQISQLSFQNLSGQNTQLYYSFGSVNNPRIEVDSTDTSGSVLGTLTSAGTFEVIVHFSTPFAKAPKAVILQAPTPMSGVPDPDYLLTVENVNSIGFDVVGSTSAAVSDGVLFYYLVI